MDFGTGVVDAFAVLKEKYLNQILCVVKARVVVACVMNHV